MKQAEIAWREGTVRTRAPDETWELLQPLLRQTGCTRVADLTGLDPSGIPVHAAIRPDARSLAVSMGKGVTSALSRVSAAMEAVECWFAERDLTPSVRDIPAAELGDLVPYPLDSLDVITPTLLSDRFPLDWVSGRGLLSGQEVLVPATFVSLDRRSRPGTWHPPLFQLSTNGLASGNTEAEAVLHALCEIIERESITRAGGKLTSRPVDPALVADPVVAELTGRMTEKSQGRVMLFDLPNPFGVPCLTAVTEDEVLPMSFGGFGCHPEPVVATCRALTEAVQQRLAVISGSRDDLPHDLYLKTRWRPRRQPADWGRAAGPPPARIPCTGIEDAVLDVAQRVGWHTGFEPVAVPLTEPDLPISVVRVVAPGLRVHTMRGLRMRR